MVSGKISKVTTRLSELATKAYVRWESDQRLSLLVVGVGLLMFGLDEDAYAAGNAAGACGKLLQYVEGPFGALITAAAGIGAIVAAALGGFKVAWTLVVTAVGAFILRAYMSLWFAGTNCTGGTAQTETIT